MDRWQKTDKSFLIDQGQPHSQDSRIRNVLFIALRNVSRSKANLLIHEQKGIKSAFIALPVELCGLKLRSRKSVLFFQTHWYMNWRSQEIKNIILLRIGNLGVLLNIFSEPPTSNSKARYVRWRSSSWDSPFYILIQRPPHKKSLP